MKFESPVVGGVKLVKTYTFAARRLRHRREATRSSTTSAAPVSPRLYLQLVRDGIDPPGELERLLHLHRPGDRRRQQVSRRSTSRTSRSAARPTSPTTRPRPTAAGSRWSSTTSLSAWLIDKPATPSSRASTSRPSPTSSTRTGGAGARLLGRHARAARRDRARRDQVLRRHALRRPAGGDPSSPRWRRGLELVKDYGFFKILAEPLFWLLTQLHKVLGNWGWSIVGLVVLLKIAFYWLNAKAYGSMAKMKAINPRIMEMRERLKDKPQQMQQEMMRIYREEKVNPLGGCLPIFVQMPFFIALYWVLLSTRGDAQRALDRLDHRPLGQGPVLHPADPDDAAPACCRPGSTRRRPIRCRPRMMWIMPLVFSVMFFFFPAGLVLYWLTNNILSIAQQYVINKRLGVLGK